MGYRTFPDDLFKIFGVTQRLEQRVRADDPAFYQRCVRWPRICPRAFARTTCSVRRATVTAPIPQTTMTNEPDPAPALGSSSPTLYLSKQQDMGGVWKAAKLSQLDPSSAGPHLSELHYLRGSLERRGVNQIVDYARR